MVRQYNQIMNNRMAAALANDRNFNLEIMSSAKPWTDCLICWDEEEKKIRRDPAAQVTSLLKEVFGSGEGRKQPAK